MLELLFNPITISIVVFTTFVPLRWVSRFWLLIALLIAAWLGFSPRNPYHGLGYAIVLSILMIHAALIGGLLLARVLLRWFRRNSDKYVPAPGAAGVRAILWADIVLCAVTGGVVAGFFVMYIAWSFAGWRSGFIIHFLVALLFAGLFAAVLHSAFWRREPRHWQTGAIALACSFAIVAASVGGAFYPAVVVAKAQSKAGDNPYCIALASRQRPARSWEDLTLFSMDKSRHHHHAILLVEHSGRVEPFYWSYYAGEFLPGAMAWNNDNWPTAACRPKTDFTQSLSAFNSGELAHNGARP